MNGEKISYKTLLDGDIPPWVMRFIKLVGKGINDYSMINDGDKVLIAASGGKDSLALSLALSLRKKWLPISYSLSALMIDWIEHPIGDDNLDRLKEYYDALGIPLEVLKEKQFPPSFKGDFNCYLCARNRRRILFEKASATGTKLIAMGHHLDDLVETSLMNLAFRASFSTMQPVQEFFSGKIYVIRPMILVHETVTSRLKEIYDLPTIKPVCPYDQTNVRARLKPIVSELCHIDKLAREHIYASHTYDHPLVREEKHETNIVANGE